MLYVFCCNVIRACFLFFFSFPFQFLPGYFWYSESYEFYICIVYPVTSSIFLCIIVFLLFSFLQPIASINTSLLLILDPYFTLISCITALIKLTKTMLNNTPIFNLTLITFCLVWIISLTFICTLAQKSTYFLKIRNKDFLKIKYLFCLQFRWQFEFNVNSKGKIISLPDRLLKWPTQSPPLLLPHHHTPTFCMQQLEWLFKNANLIMSFPCFKLNPCNSFPFHSE